MFLEGKAKWESESSNPIQLTENLLRFQCTLTARRLVQTLAYIDYAPGS
jgi:hypothetical protein